MAVPKVCKFAPFGNFSRRHNADTAAEIESDGTLCRSGLQR